MSAESTTCLGCTEKWGQIAVLELANKRLMRAINAVYESSDGLIEPIEGREFRQIVVNVEDWNRLCEIAREGR